ncbi:MAG: hypothetical protein IJZ90_03305 [Clostridia bacterium]|nr:hypothetical protein [Clostridia bacterium]
MNKDNAKVFIEKAIPVIVENKDAVADAVVNAMKSIYELNGTEEVLTDEDIDEAKTEFITAIEGLEDSWAEYETEYDDTFAESDFNIEFKFTVDENDSNYFDFSSNIGVSDDETATKLNVATALSVAKSDETVECPGASDCISYMEVLTAIMA